MATNYPTSADDSTSLPNPAAGNAPSSPSHSSLHSNANDAIKAIEGKLGTGASTPTANTLMRGTGTGTSSWSALTSAQLAASLTDETGSGSAVFATTPTLVTPKVDTINEATLNNGVTVSGLNIKSGALNTNNSVVTTNITDNSVTAAKLATNAITLGYIQITSNFTTTATSATLVTGLSATVTIPSGGRRVKITVFSRALYNSATSASSELTIWDGTVGTGTQLSQAHGMQSGGTGTTPGIAMAVVTPSAGSKTYNVGLHSAAAGTATLEAGALYPAFLLVETI
jgi:hypothetical protein